MKKYISSSIFIVFPLLSWMFFGSCNANKDQETLFEQVKNAGIKFENNLQSTQDFNIFTYRNFYNGGGVATGDLNNDGLPEVFFTANQGSNKLYLNKGNFQFEDISEKAGFGPKNQWSTGVVFADVNGDGWLDIYICNAGHINDGVSRANQLYINNKNLTFTERAKEYGLADEGYSTQASFFDYDMDGDLDCFLINNSPIPVNTLNYANKRSLRAEDWPVAPYLRGGGDHLFKNDHGHFVDVSKDAGIHGSLISFGLGVTVSDVNGDGYMDVYVSNDFFERDYLYINQKNGTFKDEIERWVQHTSLASMGADFADINNDGYPDIFTTDMLPDDDFRLKTTSSFDNIDVYRLKERSGFYHQFQQNALQLNNQHGKFEEIANYSGVSASDWSWGALMFDADNDGLTDLYVCNGIYQDLTNQDFIDFFANDVVQKMALTGKKDDVDNIISKMSSQPLINKAFKNNGNLTFTDEAVNWGLNKPSFSNGASYADLDNDGDLDLIINNVNQQALIYKNNSSEKYKKKYISFSLIGDMSNPFAIGSKIKLYAGNQILSREIIPSKGFQSSIDYKAVIGLGTISKIDSVVITWPNLQETVLVNPAYNKTLQLFQKDASRKKLPLNEKIIKPLFDSVPISQFEQHKENDYVDFYLERNIPIMLSKEGPKAAVADVNGDGKDDIYIGGAKNQAGQLYIQLNAGKFVKKQVADFVKYADFEDVAVVFTDVDGDGDKDLIVGSGGNEAIANSREQQTRLYKNDGKGNFTIDVNAIPAGGMNTSVIAANDVDGDGDIDLFIGSRSVPQHYGLNPNSSLLINDGKGQFSDATLTIAPKLANIGMVTGATWTDLDKDGKNELIIVGDWMYPQIFEYKKGQLVAKSTGLEKYFGWWQCVTAADMDGNGTIDLVLGNLGKNFYLHPNFSEPVKLWINDFDHNNNIDKILTRTINGKDVPVFLKRELEEQTPSLKKQNLRHEVFAKKSVQELLSEQQIASSLVKVWNYASSAIAYNDGKGHFTIKELTQQVQWSSVNAIQVADVNNDGKNDLILGGNQFGFLPQFCRLDANYGQVLLNTANQNFELMAPSQSGISITGEVRDIKIIRMPNKTGVLFLRNNEFPQMYTIQSLQSSKNK